MTRHQLPRVSQLTQRTNQLNLTTIRRTEGEVRTFLKDGECLTVQVTDRFGEYGLVGVVLFEEEADALVIDTFLLSCRALGRGVEHQMLARIGQLAVERGKQIVKTPYVKTAKNRPALKFLQGVASKYEQSASNGFTYLIPSATAAQLRYNPRSKPGEPVKNR